jgi:dTDP-4-dehydrorhamnose reductase
MHTKKILMTGVNGQVGHALQHAFAADPTLSVMSLERRQLDLSDVDAIRRVVQAIKPDLIINPAAYTAVDKAESEPELTYAINAVAPRVLAEEAAKIGASLIQFSTDYVYSGSKVSPYVETDATNPLSVYGQSKLAGEIAVSAVGLPHLILRTSWVYGAYGNNFLKTILRLASEREELRIVADQMGAPTSSQSIAQAVMAILQQWQVQSDGVYHLVNSGFTSWHGFAMAIVEEYVRVQVERSWPALKTLPANIKAITTQEYPTLATRPINSILDCTKLAKDFSLRLPSWDEALVKEMGSLSLN